MVRYADSEVKVFHPLCKKALGQALEQSGLSQDYEVLHHQYTGALEMDYVVRNARTKKYLCVIEVKRTPADVQSTRYQIQAQSYVQMNEPENERTFYILTNLEKLISFRYDAAKPRVYQQILSPGMENVCDFSVDDEPAIIDKLAQVFARLLGCFQKGQYRYLATLEQFLNYMGAAASDRKKWKSRMAGLMYEYIRGAFLAVKRREIKYSVYKFHDDVRQICEAVNTIDFEGIFAYDDNQYLKRLAIPSGLLADMYRYGNVNISGDSVADALHDMLTQEKRHDGEVATDPELASLAAVLAKMSNGPLAADGKICDPAAGSGNLICSAIRIFHAEPSCLKVNDVNPKLIELLSLRVGLSFPRMIAKPNVAQITIKDIVDMGREDFSDVDVVLLNPPFVAGINCTERKIPFYDKIRTLTGFEAVTKVGQMNLGAVFLELVCRLVKEGTTIVCIFPKAHLTERGVEAAMFRKMLLGLFGLHTIFHYPAEGLFDSVTEETCIFVGKVLQKSGGILVYSSDVKVADIDLLSLQAFSGGYNKTEFETMIPGVEARLFDREKLDAAVEDGWRMVCSEMSEAIRWMENYIVRCAKLEKITNTTKCYRKGQVGVNGGSDLMFFNSIRTLYEKYKESVDLKEGMRNAKCNDFVLNHGDSKFLDFNGMENKLAVAITNDYVKTAKRASKQQRKVKTAAEWEAIAKKDGKVEFSKYSVLIPTKTRRNGRVHLSNIPLYVSTNFVVFTYPCMEEAMVAASYMTTVFYQLECEVMCKSHAGVRKGEVEDIATTHVPVYAKLSSEDVLKIEAEIPRVRFLDLNAPVPAKMDEIWAEILFGTHGKEYLADAQRLLCFLANKRSSQKRNSQQKKSEK